MRPALALVGALVLAGCLGGPSVQSEPGRFEWTLDADGVTETWEHDWSNDAGSATVRWDLSMADGRLTVVIRDDAGGQVAKNTFEGGSSGDGVQTQSGRSGTWHITLEAQELDGAVKVTVRSA